MNPGSIPARLGKYEILQVLGRGAMGVVYLGRDPRIGRTLAIKTVRLGDVPDPALREEFLRRFLSEAQAAGRLSHPNIVTIFDADEDEKTGLSFIAMEYVRGRSLDHLLTSTPRLAPGRALELMRPLLSALDYAHGQGVVHRDVKPSNVLLAEDGVLKIADFGIAKLSEAPQTRTGQILGTPGYMSPEQVKGLPVDGRSDLFSAAVVLYQMLAGRKPFEGEDIVTTCYQIVHVNPPPVQEADASLPDGIDAVLRKALAKMPGERYPTGAALLADLARAIAGEAPEAATGETPGTVIAGPAGPGFSPSPAGPEPAKHTSRRPLQIGIGIAAVLILAVAGTMLFRNTGSGGGPETAVEGPPRATGTTGSASALVRGKATLRVVLTHRLSGGTIRVTLDGREAARRSFEGPVKMDKSVLRFEIEVPPGRHGIGVTVTPRGKWGKLMREEATRDFRRGSAETLRVDVGSLGREMELTWN